MSRLADYLSLVKFEHSVFALPFVLSAAFIHAGGLPTASQLGWMIVAAVSVRTAAMAFNRILDRELDALNPRTRQRELPTGRVRISKAWALTAACSGLFVFAAAMLNRLCLALSLPALIVLLGYSYTKRFTAWCHAALGLSLGIAPMGAWLAVKPTFDYPPMVLSLAVICWVAGFDIIYALLDEAFDRAHGVHSAVVALGRRGALQVSSALHAAFLVLAALFGWLTGMGALYYAAVGVVALVLLIEHAIVSPDDLSRVNAAFFTANGVASLLVLVGVCLEVFL
ncbi:MAG: 4-hydroxybenzoate octaprenyltransferase [Armatimonadetes bacterium]|nr:4-hydroxybenzoate octaprenyltransferase [Armatimonadota bacterium]